MQVAEIEAEARSLLNRLVETVPGDLGRIARCIVGTPRSDELAEDGGLTARAGDDLPNGVAAPSPAPANPIPWAPRVLVLCCQAYNQPAERAVPVGACLELLGIVSSALDAAQDGHHDLLETYGRESSGYGADPKEQQLRVAVASNAGVALIGLAWRALLDHGSEYGISAPVVMEIGQLIAQRWTAICQAQHLDLTVGRAPRITLEEYDRIVAGKAGEIGGTACEAGAILAGAHPQRDLWHTLGMERTIAQQLCDDHVDLEEDLATGQQVSHPVLYGLSIPDPDRRETVARLRAHAAGTGAGSDVARKELIHLLEDLGASYYTLACLGLHRRRALAALDGLALPPPIHAWLEPWVLRTAPKYP